MKALIKELEYWKDTSLTISNIEDIIRERVNVRDVLSYLNEQVTSSMPLAVRGYVHQLGFRKFQISTIVGAKLRRVRLHYWSRQSIFNDIHDHVASFASKILIGELGNERFKIHESGDLFDLVEFSSSGDCCSPTPTPAVKQGRLRLEEKTVVQQGETYHLHNHELHRAMPLTDHLVSLVIQDHPVDRPITVFRERSEHRARLVEAERMSSIAIKDMFREICSLIEVEHEND